MFVVVNPHARGGSAGARWAAVETALRQRIPDVEVARYESAQHSEDAIRAAIARDVSCIVVAGGDGSTNLALNAMMDPATDRPRKPDIALGAIGLGSSNDFHKPFGDRLAGVPAKLNVDEARRVDVGKASLLLPDGSRRVRYFQINASMGLVAEGNHAFTNAGGAIARLKRLSSDAAIAATALISIARFVPMHVEISSDGWRDDRRVTNIGVLKNVHFAGGMRYDTGVTAGDGRFDVNIWAAASKPQVLGIIANLYRGRFTPSRLATCRRGRSVELRPERSCPLELDGEVTVVDAARLEVIPRALLVCA